MTTDQYNPGDEIPGYLSYAPLLALELQDGGRPDLAERVREEAPLALAEFNEMLQVGLKLESGIALTVATRQRVAQIITAAGANEAAPGRFLEAVPGLFNDTLSLVEYHWEAQFEERLGRSFEAKEKRDEFVRRELALEADFPEVTEITARLSEFDDLAEFAFAQFLRNQLDRPE